jgi:hypothetical protein
MLRDRLMSDLSAIYDQLAGRSTPEQLAVHYRDATRRGEQLPESEQII